MKARLIQLAITAMLEGTQLCAETPPKPSLQALQQQVIQTERAFAKTMADRDHAAFVSFLSEEAIFFSGPVPLRGKAAVAAWWKRFYEKPETPFA